MCPFVSKAFLQRQAGNSPSERTLPSREALTIPSRIPQQSCQAGCKQALRHLLRWLSKTNCALELPIAHADANQPKLELLEHSVSLEGNAIVQRCLSNQSDD